MSNVTIPLGAMKGILSYNIDNNIALQERGEHPIAIGIVGQAGDGKTAIVEQLAKERNMGFKSLVLSQLEEAGDLIGYPIKEFECQVAKQVKDKDGNVKMQVLPNTMWLNEKQLESPSKGMMYRQTGKTRMSYAIPSWVPEYNENGTIFLLDDMSRANPILLQSIMEVIYKQETPAWKLPKKTTVVITSNPDDGKYNVSSMDPAQMGRFIGFNVTWDQDAWLKWAEEYGLDGRCINFVMSYANELFGMDDDGNRICSPRTFVMFSNIISGVKDWDNPESLNFITTISHGCFQDEGGRFSKMFNAFIRNKMHLMIQPKEMLLESWSTLRDKLENALYDSNGMYRPDIASMLERRFSNFVCAWLKSDDKTPISKVEDRIKDFLETEEKGNRRLFTQDLFYHMLKVITSDNKRQTNKLMFNPKIAKIIS